MKMIINTSNKSFQKDVIESELPVLVDFYANWCGPCKMLSPLLEDAATEYEGQLNISKIDADINSDIVQKLNVRGLPTILLFKNGKVEATKVGALTRQQLKDFIDSIL